jgi:predicted site-specific integrase-resolvase
VDGSDWMTASEVAGRFGVGVNTVYTWIRRGLLPAEKRPDWRNVQQYAVRRADARAFGERYYVGKPRPAWLDEEA